MPTASLEDSQSFSPEEARQDRETFSHQTLILTALSAINNRNHHPSFNEYQVNKERIRYMKEKADHTPVIDAATTILVTDTEILATMSRGINATHSIVALKEIERGNDREDNLKLFERVKSLSKNDSVKLLREIDVLLPEEFETLENDSLTNLNEVIASKDDVFISFPNMNEAIRMQKSATSQQSRSDPTCKPIKMGNGRWAQIVESQKSGFIFESTK
jgi:hypothetical protein